MVAEAGMNPIKFLEETDPIKRNLMAEVAAKIASRDEERREDLARRIIARLSEALK